MSENNLPSTDILALLKSGASGLTLHVTIDDLYDFARKVVEEVREEIFPPLHREMREVLLTKKEVLEKFGVCDTTLWHWDKKGYLEPVRLGRSVRYRQSDVERLLELRK